MSEKKLYARKATGLVREISIMTSVIICLCNTIGLGWQKRVFQFTGISPIPDNYWVAGIPPTVMAFLIGGIIILLSVFAFSILVAAMPRSGGGYVVISRILNPFAGFVGSWMEFLSLSWAMGVACVVVFEGSFGVFGPIVGISYGISDVYLWAGGLVLLIIFTAVAAFGVRMAGLLLQILFWIPMILTFYVVYLLAQSVANPTALMAGITGLAAAHGLPGVTASTYMTQALAQGMDKVGSTSTYWGCVSTAMIGAYYAYTCYAASSFVAGEVKEANKNMPRSLLIASVIIIIMYVTNSALSAYASAAIDVTTLPNGHVYSFFDAYAFLSWGGKWGASLSAAGVPTIRVWTTVIAAMTGIGMNLSSLNWLLFIFGVTWIINDLPPYILTCSRVLFAMAFDRVLPGPLAAVNERFHSPVNATIVTGIFGLLGVFSESGVFSTGGSWSSTGPVGSLLNSIFSVGVASVDLFDAIFFTLFAFCLVILPWRAPRIYEGSPIKIGGKVGLAGFGVAGFVANLVLDWMILTAPQGSYNLLAPSSDNWFALGFGILMGLIGVCIFLYYKYGPSGKGVDYTTIYSEIPPE